MASLITAARRTQLQARLAKKIAQLAYLYDTYDEISQSLIDEYRLDTGEGMQRAKRKKLSDITQQITALEADKDRLERILSGAGIVYQNLRRTIS